MDPSSLAMGWRPRGDTSITASRRLARATVCSPQRPSSSGPRCRSVSHMRRTVDGSTGRAPTVIFPAMPHMPRPSSRGSSTPARDPPCVIARRARRIPHPDLQVSWSGGWHILYDMSSAPRLDRLGAAVYDSAERPPPGMEELVELWRYRDLVVQLVRRDIVARYKRSLLGVAWTMLNPLATTLVLAVVFSQVFGARPAYAAYLLCGLLAWNFFAQSTLSAMRQLVWGAGLLHKIYIPRTLFAVTAVLTGLVNLVLALVPLVLVVVLSGLRPWPAALFVPVALLLLAAFALGIGLLLSTLAVHFADVGELYELLLPMLLYLTPIIYPEDILPQWARAWLVDINPLYRLIVLFRGPLYDGVWPEPMAVLTGTLWALGALALGWFVFATRADEFPYRV